MRGGIIAAVLISATLPGTALAEPNREAQLATYSYAVRCFAVAPLAKKRGVANDDGKRAYEVAHALGKGLGYTERQTYDDVNAKVTGELVLMEKDATYVAKAIADCKKIGLL